MGLKCVRTIGIEDDVQRRGQECDEYGIGRKPSRVKLRIGQGHKPKRNCHTELCEDHPATTPPQPWRHHAIHHRRPEKLQRIGQSDQRENADRLEVDSLYRKPSLQGPGRECERKPG